MSPLAFLGGLGQRALPTRPLSALMHRLTQIENPALKNACIDFILRHYDVDMSEAVNEDPHSYASFNAFFTRALKPELRPLAPEPALLCPVDGRISQWGTIRGDSIFQAKGRSFTASSLLADEGQAARYLDGHFATIYLAPNNYHRIHMPADARLLQARYIPGRLFSVSPATAQAIDGLFARNERVALHFESSAGPFVLVLVGALFVGSMETVIEGKICPPHSRQVRDFDYRDRQLDLARGQELARFNMGSTVVLLLPRGAVNWSDALGPGDAVKMGQSLGSLTAL